MSDAVVEREDNGQFVKGQSGNPVGRPKGSKNAITLLQRELEITVRQKFDPVRVARVIDKLFTMAEEGNIKAIKLLLDKIVSNANPGEDAEDRERSVVFRIENATFAARQEPPPAQEAVDAEFTVESNT